MEREERGEREREERERRERERRESDSISQISPVDDLCVRLRSPKKCLLFSLGEVSSLPPAKRVVRRRRTGRERD